MERLGEILARWLYQSRRELKLLWLKNGSMTTNRLSILIIFLFGVIPLTLYFLISGISYSLIQIVASYVFVTLLFTLTLLLVITWFKSEEFFKSNVQGFSFLQLTSSKIDTDFFGFESDDIENLLRLVNGLPAEQKIIIRETPKNKQSGNVRFLFTFWIWSFVEGFSRLIRNWKSHWTCLSRNGLRSKTSKSIQIRSLPVIPNGVLLHKKVVIMMCEKTSQKLSELYKIHFISVL